MEVHIMTTESNVHSIPLHRPRLVPATEGPIELLTRSLNDVSPHPQYWAYVLDTLGHNAFLRNGLDKAQMIFRAEDVQGLAYISFDDERLTLIGKLRDEAAGFCFLALVDGGPHLDRLARPGAVDVTLAADMDALSEFFTTDIINAIGFAGLTVEAP
jgi:hypothetical protein